MRKWMTLVDEEHEIQLYPGSAIEHVERIVWLGRYRDSGASQRHLHCLNIRRANQPE
jgi:hypothetical protein